METIMHRIRLSYDDMGKSEKRIADYVLDHSFDITGMSVSELAEISGSGDATVVRFSKRLGFSGFQSFKIELAKELSATSKVNSEIKKTDSCHDIFVKRINDISLSLKNTEEVLSDMMLEVTCKKIMSADRTVIFGLGNSASVAMDAAHKLTRIGFDAQACCDNHMQAIISSHLHKNCVAIGISHSGSSVDIVESLRTAREKGAFTVCVTNYGTSPILQVADVALFTRSEETKHSILAMSSRIAQLAIFDAIYTYLAVNMDENSVKAIYETESALQNKKY